MSKELSILKTINLIRSAIASVQPYPTKFYDLFLLQQYVDCFIQKSE